MNIRSIFKNLLAGMPEDVMDARLTEDDGLALGSDIIDLVCDRLTALNIPNPYHVGVEW